VLIATRRKETALIELHRKQDGLNPRFRGYIYIYGFFLYMVKGDPTLINDLKVSSRKMSNWTQGCAKPVARKGDTRLVDEAPSRGRIQSPLHLDFGA